MKKILFLPIYLLVYVYRFIHLICFILLHGKIPTKVYIKQGTNNAGIGIYSGYTKLSAGFFSNIADKGTFGGQVMSKPKAYLGQIIFYV